MRLPPPPRNLRPQLPRRPAFYSRRSQFQALIRSEERTTRLKSFASPPAAVLSRDDGRW